MKKAFKRVGTAKMPMNVHFRFVEATYSTDQLTSIEAADPRSQKFMLTWKQGKDSYDTPVHQFTNESPSSVKMGDNFKRLTHFYKDKKGMVQPKYCEIKLFNKGQGGQQ